MEMEMALHLDHPQAGSCRLATLVLAIHAGSSYRHPPTAVGWPSYYIEDYVSQSITFQSQLASLIAEGVFKKFPGLTVVLLESGFTWVPSFLWRFKKYWRGLTMEIPWVDEAPTNIVRNRVLFSLTPFDGPDEPEQGLRHAQRVIESLLFEECERGDHGNPALPQQV